MQDNRDVKLNGPAGVSAPRGPDQEEVLLITTKDTANEQLRTILREAIERFNNELMDDEERMLLLDRIRRLRRKLDK